MSEVSSPLLSDNLALLSCPACFGSLEFQANETALACTGACRQMFSFQNRVPMLFSLEDGSAGTKITETVKAFYEENPFPNYEETDTALTLRLRGDSNPFTHMLDEQIPHGASVLEVGCGTGQLTNFLGQTWGRKVFGADMCANSLALAEGFRYRNGIDNAAFVQMNLFRPCFRREVFDIVICNGVLHHTGRPFEGLASLVELTKPGGHLIIGLYNAYGRVATVVKRQAFKLRGKRLLPDSQLRNPDLGDAKRRAWFFDQYKHPQESSHTFGEVLKWFERLNLEFVSSLPHTQPMRSSSDVRLFEQQPRGTSFEHLLVQTGLMLQGQEGGFFLFVGRKPQGMQRRAARN
jgi:SAM-dependent methyltransferase/uncharacterized protein YbaR (Trm112 family)